MVRSSHRFNSLQLASTRIGRAERAKEKARYSKGTQTIAEASEEEQQQQQQQQQQHEENALPAPQLEDKPKGTPCLFSVSFVILTFAELSDYERDEIFKSESVQSFVRRSAVWMERSIALSSRYNVLADYTALEQRSAQRAWLSELPALTPADSLGAVTCIAWNSKHEELLYASYTHDVAYAAEGIVLAWTVDNLRERAEFTFRCSSPVVSLCSSAFNPTLLVGGTYSGKIVLWDARVGESPVMQTPLSPKAHTYPVYALDIVGSKNAHSLVSASTDGRCCAWSLENLRQPAEEIELVAHGRQPVAATALTFASGEVNAFAVGSEEGTLHWANRHSPAGIHSSSKAHASLITAVRHHPPGAGDALLLTASMDWSVKLWNARNHTILHTFDDAADAVMDCEWSPTHPAVFLTADATGTLALWNLNDDIEVRPVYITRRVHDHTSCRVIVSRHCVVSCRVVSCHADCLVADSEAL